MMGYFLSCGASDVHLASDTRGTDTPFTTSDASVNAATTEKAFPIDFQRVDALDDAGHVQDVVLHHRLVHAAHDFSVHGGEREIDAVQKEGGVVGVDGLEGVDKPSHAREGGRVTARSHVAGAAEIEYGRVSLPASDNGCHDGVYA